MCCWGSFINYNYKRPPGLLSRNITASSDQGTGRSVVDTTPAPSGPIGSGVHRVGSLYSQFSPLHDPRESLRTGLCRAGASPLSFFDVFYTIKTKKKNYKIVYTKQQMSQMWKKPKPQITRLYHHQQLAWTRLRCLRPIKSNKG